MIKNRSNPVGAKNNDSHSEKQDIVIFYALEISKAWYFPCTGASAISESVNFRAFEINVNTIAPKE